MWKPKIYLGTSVFDAILSDDEALKAGSRLLLEKCKDQREYEGYVSAYTLYELSNRLAEEQIVLINGLIKQHDLVYIEYLLPQEIDYLADCYIGKKPLGDWPAIEYYHLSTCAYLNLEYYICWNRKHLINFPAFRNILYIHKPHGYRSTTQLYTPEYLTGLACSGNTEALINKTIESKKEVSHSIGQILRGEKTASITAISNGLISTNICKKVLPDNTRNPARIPMVEITDIPLKFIVHSYQQQIERKEIPLLDVDYEISGCDMEYEMYKLDIEQGQELLKNKQVELFQNFPTEYTWDVFFNISRERNKPFIDWLLPQVRAAIDTDSTTLFTEINREYINRYTHHELDYKLYTSFDNQKAFEIIKKKALDLAIFITNNAWKNYQGFSFPGSWCSYNAGASTAHTHFILERDGGHLWVLLFNEYYP